MDCDENEESRHKDADSRDETEGPVTRVQIYNTIQYKDQEKITKVST
jgi:hypothetical protein